MLILHCMYIYIYIYFNFRFTLYNVAREINDTGESLIMINLSADKFIVEGAYFYTEINNFYLKK